METVSKNPFQITTPEDLTAQETVNLFVDVFTDFQKIIDPGHVFLMGPRGVGKSMMFRYLQPDCQCLAKNCAFSDLPFLGVYIPLKNTNFALAELKRLEDRHASDILNEHIMVTHFCIKVFESLAKSELYPICENNISEIMKFYHETFWPLLRINTLGENTFEVKDCSSPSDIFLKITHIMEDIYLEAIRYAKKLAFSQELIPYKGPLYDYIDFFIPILSALSTIACFPKETIYLLIDDAHRLTNTQARILNSWVATRTSRKISLKISTEYNYKTFYTTTGATIDTPHDYSEIDMATIYTGSSKSKYRNRIADIVAKRLKACNINISAEQFFPQDEKQEKEIQIIADEYRRKYDNGEGKGYSRSDDAIRYARPDFIKNLAGTRKSSSKYSYAGFNQLVHLSSGIVRHFLEPAHLMYAKEKSHSRSSVVITYIQPSIQDEIVREEANKFLFNELDKLKFEGHVNAIPEEDIVKLSNLIQGLGGLFRQILLSERSERRVFSIAISDTPSRTVDDILNLGIRLGYFHKSTIGRKDSKSGGRTKLFVMNRRLAPIWTLDPTGFAGYLFVTNKVIEDAIINPFSMLSRIDKTGALHEIEIAQLNLFNEDEHSPLELINEEDLK